MAIGLLTLSGFGTLALLVTIVLGYRVPGDPELVRVHFLLALGTTFLLVMAHSFVMFFLIATGVELKNMEKERQWGDSFRARTVAMKSLVFPAMTLALLLVIANFILGAATHTRMLAPWVHETLAWITFAVCAVALQREYKVLGDNNRLIAEAARRRAAG